MLTISEGAGKGVNETSLDKLIHTMTLEKIQEVGKNLK
jgi:hypothetical protein